MLTPEFLSILLLVDLFLISLVCIYEFSTYYRKLSQIKKTELDVEKKAEAIMEDVKNRCQSILSKVESRGDEILTHSELFKSDIDSALKDSLKASNNKYIQMIDQHSKQFIADYEGLLTNVKNQSIEKANKSLENIEADIKKSLSGSMNSLETEIMKSLANARQEIESYKKRELEKLDAGIDGLVVQLAKELLRTNITPKDHKKLVINALDKAKEQGMFFL